MKLSRRMAVAGGVVFALLVLTVRAARAADACSLLTAGQAAAALGVPEVNARGGLRTGVSGRPRNISGERDSLRWCWKARTTERR